MTDRNAHSAHGRNLLWLPRLGLPLLVLVSTSIGVGCFQQVRAPSSGPQQFDVTADLKSFKSAENTAASDASQSAAEGKIPAQRTSPVRVLPLGNVLQVPTTGSSTQALESRVAQAVKWVKNRTATTLWSSARPDAAAFTEIPAGSYLRVDGAVENGRLPVYYVGDGLLRHPGNAWIENAIVETVDAPAPGQVPAVDADARQSLLWVQAHRATTLWSGPDDKAVVLTDLPQWTFLKVSGPGRDGRVLVNYAGDYASRQGGIGWVDLAAVGPAGDPGRWVTNHRSAALWSGVDDNAARFTDVPQWTKLRIVDGAPPDADRMQVEFFGDGRTRLPGVAWIARADVGPITPPVPLPTASTAQTPTGNRRVESYSFGSDSEFINVVGAAAQRSMRNTGVPASVTVAQAILESDWGRSRLTRQGNNLFGIKALNGPGTAGVLSMATWEHFDGDDVVVEAPFRAYNTLEESVDDHGRFFRGRRYQDAMAVAHDARAFAHAIHEAGYATDPDYASKLIRLMDRYDLYRFDS